MEKKMKKTTLAIGFALCIGILTGCGMMRDNKEEHVPRVFGATYMTRNNPYFDVLHEAIEEGVEGKKYMPFKIGHGIEIAY